jgi:hypothetical protein
VGTASELLEQCHPLRSKLSVSLQPLRRWEDNIKVGLRGVGWGHVLDRAAQDGDKWRAVVNAVMNFRVP